MRAFLAIPMPEAVADRLSDLQDELRLGRHVPVDQLHLTLAFLGEQSQDALEALHWQLTRRALADLDLGFDGIGTLGGTRPRALSALLRADPALTALRRSVEGALHSADLRIERRRFRPHVTLARLPARPAPEDEAELARFLSAHAAAPLPQFRAGRIVLYRSVLRPDGAVHDALAEYPLRADIAP